MPADTANALLAGFLSGAAAGLMATAIALVAIARNPRLAAQLPSRLSPAALGIAAANAMLLVWTLFGLILGALYASSHQPEFSLAVSGAAVAFLAAGVYLRRRLTWPMVATALTVILAFAVMLPGLTSLG